MLYCGLNNSCLCVKLSSLVKLFGIILLVTSYSYRLIKLVYLQSTLSYHPVFLQASQITYINQKYVKVILKAIYIGSVLLAGAGNILVQTKQFSWTNAWK